MKPKVRMSEIVAARIGTTITNDPARIMAQIADVSDWLDRDRMRLMAAFDLGPQWQRLADGPTLFMIDGNGMPHPAHPITQSA